MNEDKKVNEKELEEVSGGLSDTAAFEIQWAEYQHKTCGQCVHGPNGGISWVTGKSAEWTGKECFQDKLTARAMWQLNKTVKCERFQQI